MFSNLFEKKVGHAWPTVKKAKWTIPTNGWKKKILSEIIHVDQYAYVKGRTIFDAIRTIDDIMEYTKL